MERFLTVLQICLLILLIEICQSQTSSVSSAVVSSSSVTPSPSLVSTSNVTSSIQAQTSSASASSVTIGQPAGSAVSSSSSQVSPLPTAQLSSSIPTSSQGSLVAAIQSSSTYLSVTPSTAASSTVEGSSATPVLNATSYSMQRRLSTSTSVVGSSHATAASSSSGVPTTSPVGLPTTSSASMLNPSSSSMSTPSSTSISTPLSSSAVPTQPNPSSTYQTCQVNDNPCKNNGDCFVNSLKTHICVCTGDYYGPKCDKEANPLYKPLVYAFGGSTGFLLLVICIALIITCKKSSSHSSDSRDLDDFNNIGLRAKGTSNDGMIIE